MCGKWLGCQPKPLTHDKGLARWRKVSVWKECHEHGDVRLPTEVRQPAGTTCQCHGMKRSSVSGAEAA